MKKGLIALAPAENPSANFFYFRGLTSPVIYDII